MCEKAYVAPLYRRVEVFGGEEWVANINNDAFSKLTKNLSSPPSPIEILDYAYGILHDPIYCKRFDEYLCRDFPRIPIINAPEDSDNPNAFHVSEDMFRTYVAAGERLRNLHLMQTKVPAELVIEPNTYDNMEIGAVKYQDGMLSLNTNKQIHGITADVWNYRIGGYQVLDKWFKSHKGEVITIDSFEHIANVVGLLAETIKVQERLKKRK
jgi:predicted helicase